MTFLLLVLYFAFAGGDVCFDWEFGPFVCGRHVGSNDDVWLMYNTDECYLPQITNNRRRLQVARKQSSYVYSETQLGALNRRADVMTKTAGKWSEWKELKNCVKFGFVPVTEAIVEALSIFQVTSDLFPNNGWLYFSRSQTDGASPFIISILHVYPVSFLDRPVQNLLGPDHYLPVNKWMDGTR